MRLEYKYLFPIEQLPAFKSAIAQYCNFDSYCEKRKQRYYTVRSIYLDSDRLGFYQEKTDGNKIRKKLRIRGYNEQNGLDQVFLEIKRKYNNFISKDRALLQYRNLPALCAGRDIDRYIIESNGNSQSTASARKFFYHVYKRSLKPVVLITYERYAFYSKFNKQLRTTLDFNLKYRPFPGLEALFDENDLRSIMKQYGIFEIKFDRGLPHWFQTLSKDFNLTRLAFSKYTICIDSDKKAFGFCEKRKAFIPRLNDQFTNSVKSND